MDIIKEVLAQLETLYIGEIGGSPKYFEVSGNVFLSHSLVEPDLQIFTINITLHRSMPHHFSMEML